MTNKTMLAAIRMYPVRVNCLARGANAEPRAFSMEASPAKMPPSTACAMIDARLRIHSIIAVRHDLLRLFIRHSPRISLDEIRGRLASTRKRLHCLLVQQRQRLDLHFVCAFVLENVSQPSWPGYSNLDHGSHTRWNIGHDQQAVRQEDGLVDVCRNEKIRSMRLFV